jgi:signal transduction histidine kinase
MISIRNSFSKKLSMVIMLMAVPIFMLSLGILFSQSRHIIRHEAVGRANSVLSATMQRVSRNLTTIETATNATSWLVSQYLHPDSLFAISNRIVRLNPHIDGCSISMEPDVFPKYGRYFSVYTVRTAVSSRMAQQNFQDSVETVIEEKYEYFDKIWYKMPRDVKGGCWAAYYDEGDSLELTLDGMLASYGMPLYDNDGKFIGIMSTDLSLKRLSKIVSSQEKPYPHSYFLMIDDQGRYFIHPDSTMLFQHTIFEGADPRRQADIIALGHEMTQGNSGSMAVTIDGVPGVVCYQPVPGTTWSLALVSPDSDVLAGYHRQTYIVVILLAVGLLVILVLGKKVVDHTISPLNNLLGKTQAIASGNMEVHIPHSRRQDAVGRLQNSFASMLQSIKFNMGSVRYTTEQAQRRNEELAEATKLAEEADRQKAAFIQNVSHQIRTPLNIIMGFAQILRDGATGMQEDDRKKITVMMRYNSVVLKRLVTMLFDSSDSGLSEELNSSMNDEVPCNAVTREAISFIKRHHPEIDIVFQSDVPDDFCIHSSYLYLMRSLRELLYNSAKYADGKRMLMSITHDETNIRFIVEDSGKGIAEADRDWIFTFFAKKDDLSEGLGLGLPLSKRHAQYLGGDLVLDDSYHDGCRFILTLPIK